MKTILTILLLASSSAFAQSTDKDNEVRRIEQEMQKIGLRVKDITEDKTCNTDAHCQSIAFGTKACGGPRGFVSYSNIRTNPSEIVKLAGRYTALSERHNQLTGAISDCRFEMPPKLDCVQNVCQEVQN